MNGPGRFEGKTILVTGAARGIGYASAEQFARDGGTVVATDIDGAGLEAAFSDARKQGLAVATHQQDVTNQSAWTATVNDIVKQHGRLDVLFNNAGSRLPGPFCFSRATTLPT